MLLNIRESLKGTVVAAVVLLLFVVPLVLTGVGSSFLGSAAGTNAASVDGMDITESELRRAVYQRRQQLLSRENADPNADYLKDENLRGPVLEGLTQRAAIIVSAKSGGMGISEQEVIKTIREIPDFQIDGKFDSQTYQRLLNTIGYTTTSFKAQLENDLLAAQHRQGIEASAFSTEQELAALVSLTQQKRSFQTLSVPKSLVEKDTKVTDEDISLHYEENKSTYIEDEKLTVEYIELNADQIAASLEVTEEDLKAQFEQELQDFKSTAEYEIAHILLESGDEQASKIDAVQAKLAEGLAFGEVAMEFSDDGGSKDSGGSLGVLTPGIFPEAFEQAVFDLNEGQVSEPVTTDAGVHFIKVLAKKVEEAPTYEARKSAIENDLKRSQAEEIFAENLEVLSELAFSSPDLQALSDELAINVKTTAAFTRNRGVGIANNKGFRDAAFSEEVLDKGYNSAVLELSDSQAVVLRKSKHEPERIKTLDEMKSSITQTLTEQKISDALDEIVASVTGKLDAGEDIEAVAKAEEYAYKSYDKVARTASDASFQVNNKVFAMSLGEESKVFDSVADRDGNKTVIVLTEVIPGKREDIKDQQFNGLATQLVLQNARVENSNYEAQVIADADIDIN